MPEEWTRDELMQKWRGFLDLHAEPQLGRALELYPDVRSVYFAYMEIELFDPGLARQLLDRPQTALYAAELALKERMAVAANRPRGESHIHFRVNGLPKSRDVQIEVRDIRSKHLGRFISVPGLVRRATDVRPKLEEAMFECERCHAVVQQPQTVKSLQEPVECYKDHGGCGRSSSSTRFKLLEDRSEVIDFQRLEVQEPPERSKTGTSPQRLNGQVYDDLTGLIWPGSRVTMNGILKAAPRGEGPRRRSLMDIHLEVVSVDVAKEEEEEVHLTEEEVDEIEKLAARPGAIERLARSIAPTLYGLDVEKMGIALQLIGGVAKRIHDTPIRGDIHILLLGDPSTGKSQLLSFVHQIAPRSIYATGKGASAAGLTAAVVRDEDAEGRFTLEAGALVLADRGIALIDEIDKMRPEDRSSMHEAMEQQRVSIAKAGISATLPARCSLLGAANPKTGRFEEKKALQDQIDLPLPLLHRFDAIFLLRDQPDGSTRDARMAQHILRVHRQGQVMERGGDVSEEDEITPPLDPRMLRKYIAYARRHAPPVMGEAAMERIQAYFLDLRKEGAGQEDKPALISTRHLEALIRFAEASARARLSDSVEEEDVQRSITVFERWARSIAREGEKWNLDIIHGGFTASVKDELNRLKDLIRACEIKGRGAPKSLIIERAERDLGMKQDRVLYLIEKLYQEGAIYEREDDHYRVA